MVEGMKNKMLRDYWIKGLFGRVVGGGSRWVIVCCASSVSFGGESCRFVL